MRLLYILCTVLCMGCGGSARETVDLFDPSKQTTTPSAQQSYGEMKKVVCSLAQKLCVSKQGRGTEATKFTVKCKQLRIEAHYNNRAFTCDLPQETFLVVHEDSEEYKIRDNGACKDMREICASVSRDWRKPNPTVRQDGMRIDCRTDRIEMYPDRDRYGLKIVCHR